ncbi:MAG TPA: molybdenum cofactor guanylyltransferase MobA [Burkholderiaceae bacterium]|nr:molybdenum cofactor guanylyltransferase MobA [Burkholderiaceae bacterium]
MGGLDKGLQVWRGKPLVLHALQRLAPQVGSIMVNANRHLDTYRTFGTPVWPDEINDFPGPLAGLLAGLSHCATPFFASVPCDAPLFPMDLVARLGAALLGENADIATPRAAGRLQPVFCLLRSELAESLRGFLQAGDRRVEAWISSHRRIEVPFDDALAFSNFNTLAELRRQD